MPQCGTTTSILVCFFGPRECQLTTSLARNFGIETLEEDHFLRYLIAEIMPLMGCVCLEAIYFSKIMRVNEIGRDEVLFCDRLWFAYSKGPILNWSK